MKQLIGWIGLVVVAVLALPLSALAGGWSLVTLDSSPTNVQANTPFTVGFMVRQHGKTPMPDLAPTLVFIRNAQAAAPSTATLVRAAYAAKGEQDTVTFNARPDGAVGHYVATVTLPSEGTWTWQIDAFGPVAQMSPLQVGAAPAPKGAAEQPGVPQSTAVPAPVAGVLPWIGLGAAAVGAACIFVLLRTRRRTMARL